MTAEIPHDEPTPHANCGVRPCPYCAAINTALIDLAVAEDDDTYLDARDEPWEGQI